MIISVHKLRFSYRPGIEPTVKDISFDISQGEIFGFLGPSGSGKSTTQKILIRLLSGFSGEVSVLGKPVGDWSPDYYNHIGVGFELPNHYLKLTALENLSFFASFYDRPTRDPLELLDLVGLANEAHKKVGDFSKGMRMRLNFVRALLHDPELLFLDEPTSGLDPVNAKVIKELILHERSRGKTVFLTTHNMQDAGELCDRIAFIVNGEIRLIDSPRSLQLRHGRHSVLVEYRNNGVQRREFPLDGLGENPDFLALLKSDTVESIHSREATLEDIFIQVTGILLA